VFRDFILYVQGFSGIDSDAESDAEFGGKT